MKVIIECEKLTERRKAHRYLAKSFEFPDYYGGNLDALFDCMTELTDCTVTLRGAEELRESGGYGARILMVMAKAEEANPTLNLEIE